MSTVRVISKTQHINIGSPDTAIAITNEGPIGPGGPPGVDGGMTGEVRMWAASSLPAAWLECNGAAVSRLGYPALFTVIGTTWGVGDGVNTFNVPDMRGRAPIGIGTGTGLTARALAATVGTETHILIPGETAVKGHGHTFTGNAVASGAPSNNTSAAPSTDTTTGPSTPSTGAPSDNTSNDNAGQDHTHSLSSHTHYEQHYHGLGGHTHTGSTGGQSANHVHKAWDGQNFVGTGGTVGAGIVTGGAGYAYGPTSNWAEQDHGHGFTTGGPDGGATSNWSTRDNTDGPSNNTSGGISALHTHGLKNHTHSMQTHTHGTQSHTHTMQNHTHTTTSTGTVSTLADGANGTAHNNMQPSIALKFIIKT